MIKAAILCNDQRDPLEIAMLSWGKSKLKRDSQKLGEENRRVDGIPFSPEKKYIATLHKARENSHQLLFFSGAPEVVMARSSLNKSEKKRWKEKMQQLGSEGLRIVGFGYKSVSGETSVSDNDIEKKQDIQMSPLAD